MTPGRQKGFTLIEVLVSLVILSLGLLGLAALQANSTRFNHDAHVRSIAVSQVNTMIDRMRANKRGITDGNYDALSGIPGTPPACSNCSPAQSAQLDLFRWNTDNAALLPAGQGSVNANGNIFTITVMWDNARSGATGTGCGGNPTVDLTCLRISTEL